MTGAAGAVHRFGETALLVDLPDLAAVRSLHRALTTGAPVGVVDVVPAARTVLVRCAAPTAVADARAWVEDALLRAPSDDGPTSAGSVVEILVHYDGPDLEDVARWAGVSAEEVVARHSGREYEAAFGGFAPGFTYLAGVDPLIAAPRLATPRTRVPAGSVALAGELTAVYPGESPGGWRLLGLTDTRMFDVDRDPPALVAPGARVRFVPSRAGASGLALPADAGRCDGRGTAAPGVTTEKDLPGRGAGEGREGRSAGAGSRTTTAVEVLATGPLVLVEDAGRPGLAAIGVGPSGAADRTSHALANRLVGNLASAATLEVALGGLALRFRERAVVALCGAAVPASVDGMPVGMNAAVPVPAGGVLRLGLAARGLRTYVAVRGGVGPDAVLGSRSRDTLAGIGPAPLRPGDELTVGAPAAGRWPVPGVAPVRHVPGELRPGERAGAVLEVLPGPRADWFLPGAWQALRALRTVSADSDRVAIRLDGQAVPRRAGELPSEGLVRGAVQVPPDGRPVVFLADRPVTGGYPVVGVLRADDVDRAAQLRPGDRVVLRAARPS
ncbi:urea amidolyase family protein [Cellulosimicrobium cellulans]|uniref:5-oxoprolinase subunit B/C family protein n=1 Tax=Cellulosimicrobium cellulans TaxID=1710 RepID=UPI002405F40E|nr:urea amidolyase family protein [Cellulosimicrobium cellulans]MDF9876212.1 KipI family sensor histidine kinase inhibitor [Cellulosimicrobium cellulans]